MKINDLLVLRRQPTLPSASPRKSSRIKARTGRLTPTGTKESIENDGNRERNFTQLEKIREGYFESNSFTLRGTIMYGKGHYTTLMIAGDCAVLHDGMGSVYSNPFELESPPSHIRSMLEDRETVIALYEKNAQPKVSRSTCVPTMAPNGKFITWEIVDVIGDTDAAKCSACNCCFAEGATALHSKSRNLHFHWRPDCFQAILTQLTLQPEEVVRNIRHRSGFEGAKTVATKLFATHNDSN
jgi:hypothetical protein